MHARAPSIDFTASETWESMLAGFSSDICLCWAKSYELMNLCCSSKVSNCSRNCWSCCQQACSWSCTWYVLGTTYSRRSISIEFAACYCYVCIISPWHAWSKPYLAAFSLCRSVYSSILVTLRRIHCRRWVSFTFLSCCRCVVANYFFCWSAF